MLLELFEPESAMTIMGGGRRRQRSSAARRESYRTGSRKDFKKGVIKRNKNGNVRYVSRAKHEQAKRRFKKNLGPWRDAVAKANKELGNKKRASKHSKKRYVYIPKKGSKVYKLAKEYYNSKKRSSRRSSKKKRSSRRRRSCVYRAESRRCVNSKRRRKTNSKRCYRSRKSNRCRRRR